MKQTSDIDPRGLIYDAYKIEGISEPECRSIFLDWALGVPVGTDPVPQIRALLAEDGRAELDHPMSGVLREALETPARTGRRGGASARRGSRPQV